VLPSASRPVGPGETRGSAVRVRLEHADYAHFRAFLLVGVSEVTARTAIRGVDEHGLAEPAVARKR